MNFYAHHLGDYMRDTAHLSIIEDGVYRRLLDQYYIRERPLPADLGQCCKLARAASQEERKAVAYILQEFFQLQGDFYRQKRCDDEIARYADKRNKARASAQASVSARQRTLSERSTNAQTSVQANVSTGVMLSNIQDPVLRTRGQNSRNLTLPPNGKHTALPTDVERVFDHWRTQWGHDNAKLDPKRRNLIRTALKSYTAEQLCTAISGYRNSPHHNGNNDRHTVYDALTLLLRDNEHIDAGLTFAASKEQTTWM